MIAIGGEDSAIECFDMRERASVGRIESVAGGLDNDSQVTYGHNLICPLRCICWTGSMLGKVACEDLPIFGGFLLDFSAQS